MSKEIVEQKQSVSLAPQNLEEAFKFADMLSKSNLVPKEFGGNSGNILVAVQWGAELGLQPMQAMQNIAVINGRPSLWGDAVIALVKASPLCEYVVESIEGNIATCKVKRKGEPPQSRSFSDEDARTAGLWGRDGVWSKYPKRMLQMRARSWALRDVFPDVLRGMPIAEELQDMPLEHDVTAEGSHEPVDTKKPEIEYYTDEEFEANSKAWQKTIENGKEPDRFITFIESKGKKFTDVHKAAISEWKKKEPKTIEGESTKVDDPFVADMEKEEKKVE